MRMEGWGRNRSEMVVRVEAKTTIPDRFLVRGPAGPTRATPEAAIKVPFWGGFYFAA